MKCLKLYWSTSLKNGKKNVGDWLSPLLCEQLSGRRVEHARPNRCDLIAIGSILHKVRNSWFSRTIHVWGAGLMEEKPAFRSRHHFHALRGKKTNACIIHDSNPVFGDPALLGDMLVPDLPAEKTFPIGLIPHYKDQENPVIKEFLSLHPHAAMIDVLSEPHDFIRRVASCQVVLSSSLHGLVIADSLSVPNAWVRVSNLVRGNDFKFHDYYSTFGIEAKAFPLTAQTPEADVLELAATYKRPGIERIKADLLSAFPFGR